MATRSAPGLNIFARCTNAINFLALLTALCFLMPGCATAPSPEQLASLDYGSPPKEHHRIIKQYFDDVLFDPESARYEFDPPQQTWIKEAPLAGGHVFAGYLVIVKVNAKNQLGGYTGKKQYGFLIKNERITKVLDESDLENMRRK